MTIQALIAPVSDAQSLGNEHQSALLSPTARLLFCRMNEIIELRDVSFTYQPKSGRAQMALQNLSLQVYRGEFLAVIGRNGSGKSTLAQLLNGLLLPSSGQVLVDGLDTKDEENISTIRQRVGLVFQVPDNQLIANSVEEDVAFGLENLGMPRDEMLDRVRWALGIVGMWEHRKRPPHMLSAGQKQRVAIAGILAMRPLCVVLDEATAMLDPGGRRDVLDIVAQLHAEGMTVVMITHEMSEALRADRVAVLFDGRVEDVGPSRQVFSRGDRLRVLGLDVPLISALAYELHRRQPSFPPDILSLPEMIDAVRVFAAERYL